MSEPPGTRRYAVSLHDVAPDTWATCERLLALCDRFRVPVTLLVVPRYHRGTAIDDDPAFARALGERQARGDDVVLHGYYHLDDAPAPTHPLAWARRRLYTAGEGEFDAIDEHEAARRLADGRRRLAAIDCPPRGFIAPAWLLGAEARRAVRAAGFEYTSSREQLTRLADERTLAAPSLVCSTRSRWRRLCSRAVLAWRLRALREAPLVRVALHPADAAHGTIMAAWEAALVTLAAERQPALEREVLAAA